MQESFRIGLLSYPFLSCYRCDLIPTARRVCRIFAGESTELVPNSDPVTGYIHCTLVPYWAGRLGQKRIRAVQASSCGGELFCELQCDRAVIAEKDWIIVLSFSKLLSM